MRFRYRMLNNLLRYFNQHLQFVAANNQKLELHRNNSIYFRRNRSNVGCTLLLEKLEAIALQS